MRAEELKSGDIKKFILTNGNILVGLVLSVDRNMYGYFFNETTNQVIKAVGVGYISEIKVVRLSPGVRKAYEKIYTHWQKLSLISQKIDEKTAKKKELEESIHELVLKNSKMHKDIEESFIKLSYTSRGAMTPNDFMCYILKGLGLERIYTYYADGDIPYTGSYSEIDRDSILFVNHREVARMYGSELESNGLAEKEYDDTYQTYSYNKVKNNKLIKSWVNRIAFAHKYLSNSVLIDYSYSLGDKGHVCFTECAYVKLTKSLTKEYADSIIKKLSKK